MHKGKYRDISTTDMKITVYYVVKYISEKLTLQEYITTNVQVLTAGELVIIFEYLSSIKDNTYWYWEPNKYDHTVIVSTCTIIHICYMFW